MTPQNQTAYPADNDPPVPNILHAVDNAFDPFIVNKRLQELCATGYHDKKALRQAIAQTIKAAYDHGFHTIQKQSKRTPFDSEQIIRAYSHLSDQSIKAAFDIIRTKIHRETDNRQSISIIAVGGYGRAEMAPYSDIDLLLLTPENPNKTCKNTIETLLYILWDMKLKLGYSIRTIKESIALGHMDSTIKTALLEQRRICGNAALAQRLERQLWATLFNAPPKDFVQEKLNERKKRHKNGRFARYMLEPNIKDSKGGLRDLQTLYWITKYLVGTKKPDAMIKQGYVTQAEYNRLEAAHRFLWAVRCQLHLYHGRANEKLTFDAQVEIATALKYRDSEGQRNVENFMQDYFRYATLVGDLTRIFLTALEEQHVKDNPSIGQRLLATMRKHKKQPPKALKGYILTNNRLMIADPDIFFADPLNIMRLFEQALKLRILLHPKAMRLIVEHLHLIDDTMRQSPEAARIFTDLLLRYENPERALRRMNELGVLGAYIPEFGRIVAMMQFNIYHHYTVDEHTIQTISVLSRLEKDDNKDDNAKDSPIVRKILKGGIDRKVLYIALLLHDIGKGLPRDHSIAGAAIAQNLCPRLGLNAKQTETVVWLIENHLLMSDIAQKRDLSDPRSILNFAKQVKTQDRLNLLMSLTICDIRGVGPDRLNNWKAQLLQTLYHNAQALIETGADRLDGQNLITRAKNALYNALRTWDDRDRQAELARHYPPYWQGLELETHRIFAQLLKDIGDQNMLTHITFDGKKAATQICFVMHDHPGLFSRIAGALALTHANIMDARSYTTSDGFATATFWIEDAKGNPYHKDRIKRLKSVISKTLSGETIAHKALKEKDKFKKHERDFIVPTQINFDNEGSEFYTIIEVDTRDRPGLLFDLTRSLLRQNIVIANAVIATYGVQAVDVFYVKDMLNMKIHGKDRQAAIRQQLTHVISQGTQGAMS